MRNLPPLSALRAFEAAGRCGTLSQAARELYVTHGAVSKQVKALEQALGVTLTRRTGRGVELTPQGRRVLPYLTRAFDDMQAAIRSVDSESFEEHLTISCMPGIAALWLIPRLHGFLAQYPAITLTLLSPGEQAGEEADLAILYGRPGWPDRQVTLLKQLEIFPVCSPRLMEGPDRIDSVADLGKHVLIDNPGGAHWRDFFVSQGMDPGTVRRRLQFEDFTNGIAAARAGLGMAMGDDLLMAGDLATGQLVRPLPERIHRQSLAYYLVMPPDRVVSASLGAFIDWLTTGIETPQPKS